MNGQRGEKPVIESINKTILDIKNLKTYFYTQDGVIKAVDGVDFYVNEGEVLGLVGESGCGKSVTSFSILRLVSSPGRIEGGEVLFEGRDLLKLKDHEMVEVRGASISMIFQQPQTSLNPVFRIGDQIVEVFQIHSKMTKKEAWMLTVDLLRLVGIPDPERKAMAYPHELSGGQAQRVMIAMALALNPKLLIADEPTTALDVTIQAQILDLLRNLCKNVNTAVILITHDLGVIAEMADRVAVMYAGCIVEHANVRDIYANPRHPYTQGLIASVPVLGEMKEELDTIPGNVPNLVELPPGCRFASRCLSREQYVLNICTQIEPDLITIGEGHQVRCWLYQDHNGHIAPMKSSTLGAR
jgi:oligopeptide/dipeptide ABC transporter ATP-binding protein